MKNLILRKNNNLLKQPKDQDVWSLQSQINKMFEDFLTPFDFYNHSSIADIEATAFPKINLAETEAEYKIMAELPGMSENDIELVYDDNILTISGERKDETAAQEKDYYYKESSYGSFKRSIRLPENIEDNNINAKFKNGMLIVTAPKSKVANPKAKKINIKAE